MIKKATGQWWKFEYRVAIYWSTLSMYDVTSSAQLQLVVDERRSMNTDGD